MKIQDWIVPAFFAACLHFSASASVVINEISAAGSDRLLQRDGSGSYPELGITTPWYMPEYDDSSWSTGAGPFGFGSFSNIVFGVNTSGEMLGKVSTLYLRKEFEVSAEQAEMSGFVRLDVRYNDGYIAFLNGVEVARGNMGNSGMFAYCDQPAFNQNDNDITEIVTAGLCTDLLVEGTNVFCVQVHNKSLTGTYSTSLLLNADLFIARRIPIPLFECAEQWRYFVGVMEPSGGVVDYGMLQEAPVTVPWALPGFNDSSWVETPGPVGYDRGSDYVLGTNLVNEMYGITPSVYARTRFAVSIDDAVSDLPLSLNIDYDDAIIVFLNGVEVARRNVGTVNTVTPYNTLASAGHNANGDGGGSITGQDETIQLAAASSLLFTGINVISVQIHNSSLTSSDLIGRATLSTTGPAAHVLSAPEDNCRFFIGLSEPVSVEPDDDTEVLVDEPDSEGDWIELYNSGTNTVDLSGWSLTDNAGTPDKWCFPAGSIIKAGGYRLIMATGLDMSTSDGASFSHTSFKLDKAGEYLGLYDDSGILVDELNPGYPEQLPFYSYARCGDGSFKYHAQGTPGKPNAGESYISILDPPGFSKEGGFYPAAVLFQLFSFVAESEIRYTLDGSEPTEQNGLLYSGPITLNASSVVRARCFKDGYVPSSVITHTFLIGQSSGLQSVAAFCLNSDPVLGVYGPNSLNGPADGEGILSIKGGTYVNNIWNYDGDTTAFNVAMQYGRAFEKPASLEIFPLSGVPLRVDFGLRISGSPYSRPRYQLATDPGLRFPDSSLHKPSFNFFFRNDFGGSPLDYPIFPDYSVTQFEDIRIRAGKNDIKNPFIVDELVRRIFISTGQEGSMGIFSSLYINGVYKGYFNPCEHLREGFMQKHFNSDKDWDVIQVNTFANGDATRWNEMISFLRKNDLTVTSSYCQVHNYIDVDNFIDYMIVNTFAAMWDWPHNNWVAGCERSDEGRWRFFVWDAEGGFRSDRFPGYDSFSTDLYIGSSAMTSTYYLKVIYTLLVASPEFRLRFADRVQRQCFHGGALTQSSMTEKYIELRDAINPIMQATVGQTVIETFYNNWIATDTRRTTWFGQLVTHDLWPSTLAPEFSIHGGEISEGTAVSVSNPNGDGTVYFTTNGVDPRMCGGAVSGMLYSDPLVFNSSVLLKSRVLSSGGEWSPLQEAFFHVPVAVPEFLPDEDADWTLDSSWNSNPAPYPDGMDASVLIYGPSTDKREITLRAPVTVSDIHFSMEGCLFRDRICDSGSNNTLTFSSSTGEGHVTVDGVGAGFVEFEVEAGTILNSDLRITVDNTMGDDEYGGLRLRENWSGPGSLIKDGPGMASLTGDIKSYTGSTVVNQGVLRITEPACPRQSTSVVVNSGGQLRFSSSGTATEPRVYSFGGICRLGSNGRGGQLPDWPGLGESGALRYDPDDDDDSYAILSNQIEFIRSSVIHVEGSDNTLSLAGTLQGIYGFIKTGGGILYISTTPQTYSAPITVSNGTLLVNGLLPSAVDVGEDGALSGSGEVGPLQGGGTVALNGAILKSSAAVGLNYEFLFNKSGSPVYQSMTDCGNSLLRLTSIQAGSGLSSIGIYLDCSPVAGDCMRGGIFVEGGNGLMEFLSQATVTFYIPDDNGKRDFAGGKWSVYSGILNLTATVMPESADFGDGPRAGEIIEVRVAGPAVTYYEWMLHCFTNPADRADPDISGPMASPAGDGTPNLMRYAFDLNAYESTPALLPSFTIENGVPLYEFSFDPGKNDITAYVEAGFSLTNWTRTLFDSRSDDLSRWDGERVRIQDDDSGPSISSNHFYRLRLLLDE